MAFAQNSAHGVVISEDDGSPVVGAYVVVNGDNTNGTMTDAEGRFSLRNIPSLAKTLHVSCVHGGCLRYSEKIFFYWFRSSR